MRRKLPLQPAGLALVASLLLALLLWASNRSWQSLIEAESWVKHTHEIQLATERLQRILVDAETGQRGFLVTGNESYLAPYHQVLEGYRPALEDVRKLAAYSPAQQQRVERLEPEWAEPTRRFMPWGAVLPPWRRTDPHTARRRAAPRCRGARLGT
ncbi:hypothetical protein F0U60_25710 [Archangium minus]|uniref:CHASE3 domain-containing protein n=1 Tax=Archangium minus TaxID=83450 RepID=A0ABY9WTM8_9BACT|nr:hypothetical protein F0U60_25710 [Archangium minus]